MTERMTIDEAARIAQEAFAPYECKTKEVDDGDLLKVAVDVNGHWVDVNDLHRDIYSDKETFLSKLEIARQRMTDIGAEFEQWRSN
ncbi:hypothetical protein MHM84_11310 [Halomonas sp. McH1-25]|uniref:hypothetical protein n=1 Tax=unclassified Halomonas TaxID=2609666 RepID=UPI001EF5AA42|nr:MULTISPECIES: hypothetical protein [unclassified Halomonas]MCG7600379.1 hypothetical protein [Halomonas sp. McH1-25]MCP1344001.1 hypothetical protein [Halomonas sp. FL8]MCP1361505.1 hypothetical protein [Halomonas sp. BBD45]MCP1367200.1 hypothetical protein [Halomonas sp. BBD48]